MIKVDAHALIEAIADLVADKVAARIGGQRADADGQALVGPREVGITASEWRTAVARGELRAFKVGRRLVARRADVDAFLERRRVTHVEPSSAAANDDDDADEFERALRRSKRSK